ncbi:hypothetical protein JHD46_04230 [Sulfurimonas sp. SAG-AH-194-C20]|nr:hypothetical protein [Sulfurimonas sp. SAG-AH-194-C20]MDF1878845.1 hypothetical protein [Sulfurimonas sp. SAG-AH-194-C20]
MGILLITLASALVFGLIIFFICEEKSLTNANFSDMKGLFTEELKLSECVGEFNTVRYMLAYVAALFFFDLIIAQTIFIENNFGMAQIMAYVFMPSLVGSWIILLVKWTYQPMIKVISSFMYGGGFIGAAVFAFAITYVTSLA